MRALTGIGIDGAHGDQRVLARVRNLLFENTTQPCMLSRTDAIRQVEQG